MKLALVVPVVAAAVAFAFVLPDEEVLADIAIESRHNVASDSIWSQSSSTRKLSNQLNAQISLLADETKTLFDKAFSTASEVVEHTIGGVHSAYVNAWVDVNRNEITPFSEDDHLSQSSGSLPSHHHWPPHHGHHKPNKTIYQLIAESKYTTTLAKLIEDDDELIKVLNGTAANYTVFAPTDKAFEKIPKDKPQPSKEEIRQVLLYHVSPEYFPAPKIFAAHTISTLKKEEALSAPDGAPQRLRFSLSFRGLSVNFYVRVIAPNIFATNGVIHGVDHVIVPPPPALEIIEYLPSEFSTLELGLIKTGLIDVLKEAPHRGSTIFAPSNYAFDKLGAHINGFLFSKKGENCLAALLKYHVVHNQTLYSNAFYRSEEENNVNEDSANKHIDLPTLLNDKSLSIDVASWGPFISIKINGFTSVSVQDGVAKDGVVHEVSDVLIPPKRLGGAGHSPDADLTVEELIERLEPLMEANTDL